MSNAPPTPDATRSLGEDIERAIGEHPIVLTPLHGGCVAQVFRAEFESIPTMAVKHEPGSEPGLDIEGFMLGHLSAQTTLPLPEVMHAEPRLLVLRFIKNDGVRSDEGEVALADMMADLHATDPGGTTFGLERDTRIGPLAQPNAEAESWAAFYRDERLVPFGDLAQRRGGITVGAHEGLRRLADRLESWLGETQGDPPALLHGDLWAGNILWDRGMPRALIDPACYRGHPEVELAFIDLMGGLGPAFWGRYHDRRPPRPGWEDRRSIYQLYPLLVHAALFGGGYGSSVSRTLEGLGV